MFIALLHFCCMSSLLLSAYQWWRGSSIPTIQEEKENSHPSHKSESSESDDFQDATEAPSAPVVSKKTDMGRLKLLRPPDSNGSFRGLEESYKGESSKNSPPPDLDMEELERAATEAVTELAKRSVEQSEAASSGRISDAELADELPEQHAIEPVEDIPFSTQSQTTSEHGSSVPPSSPLESSFMVNWQKGGLLGQGSFGTVYLGLNLDTGELIAVKQVELAPLGLAHSNKDITQVEEVKSLMQEIDLLKTLTNEHIVRYLGCAVEGSTFNIFEEYVPGGSIASIVKRFGTINESLIKVYTKQILLGLVYLHSRQIIHRDVKGANILVDTRGSIRLADFGAAKKIEGLFAATNRSGIGSLKGTVFWMAPEVIRESSYGHQCDIWSLGCTVIEMSTGKPPWSGAFDDQVSALFQIATTNDCPPIPATLSEIGKDFLLQCFKIDPLARPAAQSLLQHPWLRLNPPESPFIVQTSPLRSPFAVMNDQNSIGSPYTSDFDNIVYDRPEIDLRLPLDKFKSSPRSPRSTFDPSRGLPPLSQSAPAAQKRPFVRTSPGTPKSKDQLIGPPYPLGRGLLKEHL